MTVMELTETDVFRKHVRQLLENEMDSHQRAAERAVAMKMRLQRTPIDRMMEKGVMDEDRMIELFRAVLNKSLIGFSAEERAYIYLLGYQAGTRATMELKGDKHG